jgi:gephyrin
MGERLKAAVLVVSTTAAKDPSTDASASVLRGVLNDDGAGQWEAPVEAIVSDDVAQIQRQVTAWSDGPDPVNLIVTTGGTGFAVWDSTPEVGLSNRRGLCEDGF